MTRKVSHLIAMIALIPIAAVAGCARPMKPADFIAENYAPINLLDKTDLGAFSLLDPYLKDNVLFFTGENHGARLNRTLSVQFLKYFHEKGAERLVLRRNLLQLGQRLEFAGGRGQVERLLRANRGRHRRLDEIIERGRTDGVEHVADVVRGRTDVAMDEAISVRQRITGGAASGLGVSCRSHRLVRHAAKLRVGKGKSSVFCHTARTLGGAIAGCGRRACPR